MKMLWLPQFTDHDVKLLEEIQAYAGYCNVKRFKVQFPLFAGGMSEAIHREVLCREDAVAILLFDPNENKVVLIEQMRVATLKKEKSPWILEIVAGMIENGHQPEETALREAEEEAGYKVLSLLPICIYLASPGISDERTFVYCGKVKIRNNTGELHGLISEGEDIKVHVLPILDAFSLLEEGNIKSASAIIALQWLKINRSFLHFPE